MHPCAVVPIPNASPGEMHAQILPNYVPGSSHAQAIPNWSGSCGRAIGHGYQHFQGMMGGGGFHRHGAMMNDGRAWALLLLVLLVVALTSIVTVYVTTRTLRPELGGELPPVPKTPDS
jgi:hypothetical protein